LGVVVVVVVIGVGVGAGAGGGGGGGVCVCVSRARACVCVLRGGKVNICPIKHICLYTCKTDILITNILDLNLKKFLFPR
jgi:hypothetical protein